jgi:hypothetical protein
MLFYLGINQTYIFLTYFSKKYSNVKFSENLSRGSQAVPCRQTARDRFTDMMNLTVALCNFVNVPIGKNLGEKKTIYRVNLYKQTVKVVTAKCMSWCFGRFLRLYKH